MGGMNKPNSRPNKIGDAILLKQGWHIIVDIGVPSGALTYRPPTEEEWKTIEIILEGQTVNIRRIAGIGL